MDYIDKARIVRHASWARFCDATASRRIILATTMADLPYTRFQFEHRDILLFGRESAGAPDAVHNHATHRITIPMQPDMRSLNVAMSCAMITGEALRQLDQSPLPSLRGEG